MYARCIYYNLLRIQNLGWGMTYDLTFKVMFPKDKGQRKNKPTAVFRLFELILISTIVNHN